MEMYGQAVLLLKIQVISHYVLVNTLTTIVLLL